MSVATMSVESLDYQSPEPTCEKLSNSIIQTVSSELSTPLNIMMGYASLLYEGALGELTPEQQSAISSIVTRADGMRSLVNRLNILMEAEAGLGAVVPLNFSDILKQVLASKIGKIDAADLRIHPPALLQRYTVFGNQTQLVEMVNSLLDNAIKFTPRGGEINLNLITDEEFLYFNIEDTGIGIADSALTHIFTSFRQTSEKLNGNLGLGLSIIRAVARKHGGEARVYSELGVGSRFAVKLPLASVTAAEAAALALPAKHGILIVDDDESVAFTMEHAIKKLPNCKVTVAKSGEEALLRCGEETFDLVFTDYQMPNMNGIELTKAMRVINPAATIILITAFNSSSLQEEAEKLDVHGYLKKPLDIKDIRATVWSALKTKEIA